ncbi:MAG: metallophosphoesterase, partial [Clostridiales bacterium]|nr:metallophosphoesterase [Clostridiales bacterium]
MTEGPMNIIARASGAAGKSDGEPLKFIHCSDLHLDSSLETKLSGEDARRRRYEIVRAFERIVRRAEEQHVTGIIIAGDMFDADIVTARTRETVLDIIRRTPAIDYLYLSGNHDSAERVFPLQGLPENLLTFRSQWQTYRYGNVDITGAEP